MNPNSPNKDVTDFMLSEYDHIANAHFETGKQISIFFRYYLIVMSAPAFLVLLVDKDIEQLKHLLVSEDVNNSVVWLRNYIFYFFIIVSITGLFLSFYLTKLKFNGTLYARTVNGVRKYFSDANSDTYLVLGTDMTYPQYFGFAFLSLVIIMGLLDSAYFYLSLSIKGIAHPQLISILFLLLHPAVYTIWSLTKK